MVLRDSVRIIKCELRNVDLLLSIGVGDVLCTPTVHVVHTERRKGGMDNYWIMYPTMPNTAYEYC